MTDSIANHKTGHSEAERALWLVYVMQYTAEELDKPITETARLLDNHGFIEKVLNGYEAFHTQGFEYMAELLTSELNEAQRV
jgi:hypothetical protein